MKNMQCALAYLFVLGLFATVGCVPAPVKFNEQQPVPPTIPAIIQAEKKQIDNTIIEEEVQEGDDFYEMGDPYGLYRKRREIPVSMNKYEGSLWKGDNPFGNFMRDNRAQNIGDLLKITGIQKMVTQFDEVPVVEVKDVSSDIDIFKIGEAERLQVHKGIEDMTVKVVNVSRSGLMAIYGQKMEYKDSNNTRYRTLLTGYIRPEDVNEDNTLPADKVQSFYFNTERKVKITEELRRKIIENIKNLNALKSDKAVSEEQTSTTNNTAEIQNIPNNNSADPRTRAETENANTPPAAATGN